MQSTQTPTLIPLPFASAGGKNTIPEASQLPGNPGGASFTDGFPPATRTPLVAGGIPPAGLDMNGILYMITQSTRWSHAGGLYGFSSSFAADTNVGGYPNGAELMSADLQGTWISNTDNNTDNPDTGPGTKWVPGRAYGVTALSGLTNANVTLTPAQAAKNKITLAGALTGNIQIIVPAWIREWSFVNNTTGNFTITVKTASGTGVVLAAGQQKITGDGTNILQPAESVATATLPTHAMQFGQATGRLLRTTVYAIVSGQQQISVNGGPFTTTSATSYSSLANCAFVEVEGIGGGGAGGGNAATSSTAVSAGSGGASGSWAKSRVAGPLTSVAVTIGLGGTGNSAAGGNSGGATSLGALLTCPGGGGGGAASISTSVSVSSANQGAPGAMPTGTGLLYATSGQPGTNGLMFGTSSAALSGQGAPSPYGAGGPNGLGSPGIGYGSGGSGAGVGPSQAANAGGKGGDGFLMIREYA